MVAELARRRLVLQVPREHRAVPLELAQQPALEPGMRLQELPAPLLVLVVRAPRALAHPRADEREVLDRPDEGVPLEELPLLPEQPVELGAVVRPEAAPRHEVLRRRDGRDRVDLEVPKSPHRVEEVARRAVEQLRADCDPPCLLGRDELQRWTRSSPTIRRRRSSARSRASSSAPDRRMPGSTCAASRDERPRGSLRLEVDAADDAIAPEERKHVVPVHTLGGLFEDLHDVVEVERAEQEPAIPDEVVEGRQEDRGGGPRRVEVRTCGHEHRSAAVLDRNPLESSSGDELVRDRSDARRAATQVPVVCDARLGQHASGENCPPDELAHSRLLVGDGCVEDFTREDALPEVVQSLEAVHAAGDDDLAAVPQRLEHHLRGLPTPHPDRALAFELPRRHRAALADHRAHLLRQLRVLGEHVAAPGVVGRHPRAVERPVLDRKEARLVRPELEHATLCEEPGDGLARVGADPRAEDDPVAPLDGRDRVDLHARELADRLLDLARVPVRARGAYPCAWIASRRSAVTEAVRMASA